MANISGGLETEQDIQTTVLGSNIGLFSTIY